MEYGTFRYWRVKFVPNKTENLSCQNIASLIPCDETNTPLSVAPTVVDATKLYDEVTYPVSNVLVDDTSFACMFWDAADYFAGYIRFEYDVPTTINRFKLNFVTGDTYGARLVAAAVDVWVEGSWDNASWVVVGAHRAPVASTGTPVYISTAYKLVEQAPYRRSTYYNGTAGIFGIVAEDGVPMANYPVHLYERDNFTKIGSTLSAADGSYSFNGLNADLEYCVMAHDPTGPQPKNALVFDRVKPINSLSALNASEEFWHCRFSDPKMGGFFALESFVHGAFTFFTPAKLSSVGTADGSFHTEAPLILSPASGWLAEPSSVPGVVGVLGDDTVTGSGFRTMFRGGYYGADVASNVANYGELTFEYIIKTPETGKTGYIVDFLGLRDDGYNLFTYVEAESNAYPHFYRAVMLEVDAVEVKVRMALGSTNMSTVRATATVSPDEWHHVVVTYKEGLYIKVYIDGTLQANTSLGGAGRLFTYVSCAFNNGTVSWSTYLESNVDVSGFARCLQGFQWGGKQSVVNNSSADNYYRRWGYPPILSGGVAYAGILGRVLSDEEVAKFYGSYADPDNYVYPAPILSGYGQEVIADLPTQYLQLSDPSYNLVMGERSAFGRRDFQWTRVGVPTYGNTTSFADGRTSVYLDGNSAFNLEGSLIAPRCTLECFFRVTNISGDRVLFSSAHRDGTSAVFNIYLASDRNVKVDIYDYDGGLITYTFQTAAYIALNQRHHFALIMDNVVTNTIAVFIDGVRRGEYPFYTNARTRWAKFTRIGQAAASTSTSRFVGQISDVAFYGGVLSDERIAAHFAASSLAA
jgi:hypothetical protein